MRLGENVHVTIHLDDLAEALPFYQGIGYRLVRQAERPAPSVLLSDGVVLVQLEQDEKPFQGLTYYTANLAERLEHLERVGVTFTEITMKGERPASALFYDLNGCGVRLVAADPEALPRPEGNSFSECGKFGEFSIPTRDLKTSLAFWENLGFTRTDGDDAEPYPWAFIKDGLIAVGLHQTDDFSVIMLSYFAQDMVERIARLKAAGMPFVWERKNEQGQSIHGRIQAPDGQSFFLFLGEV